MYPLEITWIVLKNHQMLMVWRDIAQRYTTIHLKTFKHRAIKEIWMNGWMEVCSGLFSSGCSMQIPRNKHGKTRTRIISQMSTKTVLQLNSKPMLYEKHTKRLLQKKLQSQKPSNLQQTLFKPNVTNMLGAEVTHLLQKLAKFVGL